MNPKAHRAAVFAGWKDMNDYMTQNKIEVVLPVVPRPEPEVKKKKKRPVETESEHAANPSPESGEAAHPEGEKPAKGGHASYGRRGSLDS
ncbi:MAG: hypothetical protein JNJ60_21890 [Rhodocyclaceae bacterium]|nr:hypothetical protein [Rhodocyclaceae bacterium]